MCDKNPVSADFYGSDMSGKLTRFSPLFSIHPRATQHPKSEQIRSALFSLPWTVNIDPTVQREEATFIAERFIHLIWRAVIVLWVLVALLLPLT